MTRIKYISSLVLLMISSQTMALPISNQLCDTSDLTLSKQCVGVFDPGNDNGVNTIFSSSDFTDTFGDGWSLISKVEDQDRETGDVGLTLNGTGGNLQGTWEVSSDAWSGFQQGNVIAILKAGNTAAAYEIDLGFTSGTWNVTSDAWPQNSLSHFSFWSSAFTSVPEPSIVALFGIGLIGLVVMRRKMKG